MRIGALVLRIEKAAPGFFIHFPVPIRPSIGTNERRVALDVLIDDDLVARIVAVSIRRQLPVVQGLFLSGIDLAQVVDAGEPACGSHVCPLEGRQSDHGGDRRHEEHHSAPDPYPILHLCLPTSQISGAVYRVR